ncbi:MAG: mechanosensitive ion channel protein MscS [Bacteroides sp. SM23_62_1]|nr:MAG: mechanosensitive ion channel protein MscS [Bacteroides sp. SM23_62_1]
MNLINNLIQKVEQVFQNFGLSDNLTILLRTVIVGLIIILLALLADFLTKRILVQSIRRIVARTKVKWDDILIKRRVFIRLAHLVPALILYYSAGFILADYPVIENFAIGLIKIYMILVVLLIIDNIINALHEIYHTFPVSENRPIKGYVQVVKIFFYFIAVILILAIILGKSPKGLLTGLSALAAVLLLVFKDTILGLVASIQLSANKMVKPGDWIEMPKFNADGTVFEITLNTVKVQNWDKTIVTIPTYSMVSDAFTNWKGMEESGGRRIKRSINIDMQSVKFCDDAMLKKFSRISVLKSYIETRKNEIEEYNKTNQIDDSVKVNGRRMTNLGTFRKYIEEYLRNHPKIHQDMTFLVRHLQPTEKGIPIEIYVFSNDQAWANYEAIQADIFDHILAVIPEFELRVFQNPTGADFLKLAD